MEVMLLSVFPCFGKIIFSSRQTMDRGTQNDTLFFFICYSYWKLPSTTYSLTVSFKQ